MHLHKIRERKVKTYQKVKRSQKDSHAKTNAKYFDGHGRLSQYLLFEKDGRACRNTFVSVCFRVPVLQ